MPDPDDHALLREFVDRASDEAFAALVARHAGMVYSVALRHTGNPHQAEEITQAVFVILARKCRALGPRVVLAGWLHHTARLTARSFVRSEARRSRREQTSYMQNLVNRDEAEGWRQIAPLLDDALARLNAPDRHAVILRFVYGKTMKEVGAVLGGSEAAARVRLHRALEKLRQSFCQRGLSSTTELIAGALSAHALQAAPLGLAQTAAALALAHDPAASPSLLTLIKSTLKVMAWTKAKTAVVTAAILLLAAGSAPVIVREIHRHANSPSGPRTTPATETIKGQLFRRGQLVDAGNATPEAAWETRYWARAQGDYAAVIAATIPSAVNDAKSWMGDPATFRRRSQDAFATLQGFQILASKNIAIDQVELKYQFGFGDDSPRQIKIVDMTRQKGAWRSGPTRAYDPGWDADSVPEPQP